MWKSNVKSQMPGGLPGVGGGGGRFWNWLVHKGLFIYKFIEQHNNLNPEQFGFRPNSRTTDSLFFLQQLINKYTKLHKQLYVGFIDYERAFDSVWQSGLIYKLYQYGVKGKFFKVVKSM